MKLSEEMHKFLRPYGQHTLANADAVAQWAGQVRELEALIEKLKAERDAAVDALETLQRRITELAAKWEACEVDEYSPKPSRALRGLLRPPEPETPC